MWFSVPQHGGRGVALLYDRIPTRRRFPPDRSFAIARQGVCRRGSRRKGVHQYLREFAAFTSIFRVVATGNIPGERGIETRMPDSVKAAWGISYPARAGTATSAAEVAAGAKKTFV